MSTCAWAKGGGWKGGGRGGGAKVLAGLASQPIGEYLTPQLFGRLGTRRAGVPLSTAFHSRKIPYLPSIEGV